MTYAPRTMPRIKISKDVKPYSMEVINELKRYAMPCDLVDMPDYWVLVPIINHESNRPNHNSDRERKYNDWLDSNLERIKSFGIKASIIY